MSEKRIQKESSSEKSPTNGNTKGDITFFVKGTWFFSILAFLFLSYILSQFFFAPVQQFDPKAFAGQGGGHVPIVSKISLPKSKPFSEYRDIILQRDIFKTPYIYNSKNKTPQTQKQDKIVSKATLNITKDYRLVGIILDHDSKAIIEDLKNNQTLFISEGEALGNTVLEKIEEGKIILLQGDEYLELTP